jgi:protein import protein ZIM17
MRRALRSALRAAEALMPPARVEAAPPASRVPPAAALAMARALSGASGSGFVGAPGSASEPSAPPAAGAAAAEPLLAAAASSRKEMIMVFTCGRCETRAVKGFSRQAYEHGTWAHATLRVSAPQR